MSLSKSLKVINPASKKLDFSKPTSYNGTGAFMRALKPVLLTFLAGGLIYGVFEVNRPAHHRHPFSVRIVSITATTGKGLNSLFDGIPADPTLLVRQRR